MKQETEELTIQETEELTMTVRSAAKALKISHVSLFSAINRGEFKPAFKIGHRTLVSKIALARFIENAGNKE